MTPDRKNPGVAFWATVGMGLTGALLLVVLIPTDPSSRMFYVLWAACMQVGILFKYRPAEFALLVAITWAIVFAVRWAIKKAF